MSEEAARALGFRIWEQAARSRLDGKVIARAEAAEKKIEAATRKLQDESARLSSSAVTASSARMVLHQSAGRLADLARDLSDPPDSEEDRNG